MNDLFETSDENRSEKLDRLSTNLSKDSFSYLRLTNQDDSCSPLHSKIQC